MWANIDPMSSQSVITDHAASNTLIVPVTIINFSELTISAIEKYHFYEIHYFFPVVPKYSQEKYVL